MVFLERVSTSFLKEFEWRFNNNDPKEQLKLLRNWVRQSLK